MSRETRERRSSGHAQRPPCRAWLSLLFALCKDLLFLSALFQYQKEQESISSGPWPVTSLPAEAPAGQ